MKNTNKVPSHYIVLIRYKIVLHRTRNKQFYKQNMHSYINNSNISYSKFTYEIILQCNQTEKIKPSKWFRARLYESLDRIKQCDVYFPNEKVPPRFFFRLLFEISASAMSFENPRRTFSFHSSFCNRNPEFSGRKSCNDVLLLLYGRKNFPEFSERIKIFHSDPLRCRKIANRCRHRLLTYFLLKYSETAV